MRFLASFTFILSFALGTQVSAQNPKLLKDIYPGGTGSFTSQAFEIMNSNIYLSANNGVHGYEMWKTDGTTSGTVMVCDLYTGSASGMSSGSTRLFNRSGTLFLCGNDGSVGFELYRNEGTNTLSTLVKNIFADTKREKFSSDPFLFTYVNGITFFNAQVALHKAPRTNQYNISERELFRTDGTAAGTFIVKDLDPKGTYGTWPICLTAWNNLLYFFGYVEGYSSYTVGGAVTFGQILCRSDGTASGTFPINTTAERTQNYVFPTSNYLYFPAKTPATGEELWKTDGTTAGTVLVKDINTNGDSKPGRHFVDWNGTLYFTADDGQNGRELWKSDGTSAGTGIVKDINTGSGSSDPLYLTLFKGNLYFMAAGPSGTRQLWKSDGTGAGTIQLKQINPSGNGDPSPYYPSYWQNRFPVIGDYFYFTADDGTNGIELWKSDGTEAGTTIVKDVNTTGGCEIKDMVVLGNLLIYSAELPAYGRELWVYDPAQPVSKGAAATRVPADWALSGNYPNPFSGSTTITIDIPSDAFITLRVYDALGRETATLTDGWSSAGSRSFAWDASALPPGMYICRLDAAGRTIIRTMLLGR